MLFWASASLGISYFTAQHFPFKPLVPLPPKKIREGRTSSFLLPGAENPSYATVSLVCAMWVQCTK